jgi:hypothetical protein
VNVERRHLLLGSPLTAIEPAFVSEHALIGSQKTGGPFQIQGREMIQV